MPVENPKVGLADLNGRKSGHALDVAFDTTEGFNESPLERGNDHLQQRFEDFGSVLLEKGIDLA
jgi:hypothetical protein